MSFASVAQPISFTEVMVFDAKVKLPTLQTIEHLEEVTTPMVEIDVAGDLIKIPAAWHVMIMETENFTIDTIPVSLAQVYENIAPGFQFVVDSGVLKSTKPIRNKMIGVRYIQQEVVIHPSIPKNSAFLIPANGACIIAGPHDLSRYLSKLCIGDIH
jgi:hypothetical protein